MHLQLERTSSGRVLSALRFVWLSDTESYPTRSRCIRLCSHTQQNVNLYNKHTRLYRAVSRCETGVLNAYICLRLLLHTTEDTVIRVRRASRLCHLDRWCNSFRSARVRVSCTRVRVCVLFTLCGVACLHVMRAPHPDWISGNVIASTTASKRTNNPSVKKKFLCEITNGMCEGAVLSTTKAAPTCGGGSIGNSGGGVRHGRSRGGRATPRLTGGWWPPLSCSVMLLLLLLLLHAADLSSSVQQDSSPSDAANKGLFIDDSVQDYLRRFGYLQSDYSFPPGTDLGSAAAALRTETSVRHALSDLQSFAGIPVTGRLDNATVQLLRTPRCGVPDVGAAAVDEFVGGREEARTTVRRRHKRFMLHGQQWPRRNLTWSLRRVPANLNRNDVRWTLSNALNVWARHSRLTFSEWDTDRADIIINFHRESHGDNFPFDGKGQVLAHAFFPGEGIGGDAHFDEDEVWLTTEPEQENRVGTNLFHVAAHEFGHSLGLQHSHEPLALMYPFYQHNIGNNLEQLPDDDRAGIQALYGAREDTDVWRRMPSVTTPRTTTTTTHPTTTSPPPPPPPPMPPRYPKPTYYPRHPTYHTPRRCDPRKPYSKHCKYPPKYPLPPPPPHSPPQLPPRWTTTTTTTPVPSVHTTPRAVYTTTTTSRRHVSRGGDSGRGKKDKVPDTCNTNYDAISVIRREVFIFKNQYFWRIGEQGLLRGYPVLIERMWHGLPSNLTHVDAVYERPDNRIVFFIGMQYYIFIGNQVDPRSAGGHPLTDLGLPADLQRIDAALVWGHNGRTFLFSGALYWRLDEELQRVELDYPRSIEMWRGVGQHIDAAFQWKDGYTYFFKGKGFWRFNDLRMRVENERQTLSAPFWMGCDVQRLQIADRSAYVNQILPHTAASAKSNHNAIYLAEFTLALTIVLPFAYHK